MGDRYRITGKSHGITFTELMITLFFFNVTLLAIIGVISLMLRSSQKSIDLSSGTLVAGEVLDQFLENNPVPAIGQLQGELYSEGLHFEYKIDVIQVYPKLKKIEAKIFWWSSATEYREGYGQLFTTVTTMATEKDD
ncbi:MAG: hypothetical protein RDV48_25950 [Candidatus Eremiobacteraeota bacterium]|nr:hypothetical protein [Candidatus Eremiobacteraeota bacterium]